jgi:hypothetical protein
VTLEWDAGPARVRCRTQASHSRHAELLELCAEMDQISKAKLILSDAAQLIHTLRSGREALRAERRRARELASQARALRAVSSHDVVPLYLAVLRIFGRLYDERMQAAGPARIAPHLDGLAYTVAEYVPIYTYTKDGSSLRALTKAELTGGVFEDGAKALTYIDGRATVRDLAVRARAVDMIALTLIAAASESWMI